MTHTDRPARVATRRRLPTPRLLLAALALLPLAGCSSVTERLFDDDPAVTVAFATGFVVAGAPPVLATLRERGVVAVASASLDVATEYARAWGYALVLDDRTVHEVARGASQVARDGEDGLACVLRVLKGTR